MVSAKFFDIGLMLTIFLVAVSGLFTFVNSYEPTGITPVSLYSSDTIESSLDTINIGADVNQTETEPTQIATGNIFVDFYRGVTNTVTSGANAVSTGLTYVSTVLGGLIQLGSFLFSLVFGWMALVDKILEPIGLSGIALVIKAILGMIEFIVLFTLVSNVVFGLAGRFT